MYILDNYKFYVYFVMLTRSLSKLDVFELILVTCKAYLSSDSVPLPLLNEIVDVPIFMA